jgi:O-antigen ligase
LVAALVAPFIALRRWTLYAWLLIFPIAYPFLHYPTTSPQITFDRVWILAMLAVTLLTELSAPRTSTSRLVKIALLWLLAAFGVRALFTTGVVTGTLKLWLDAIVLPVALFFVASRRVRTRSDLTWITGGLAFVGALVAVIGIAEKLLGFELASYSGATVFFDPALQTVRVSGPFSGPEPYALVLIVCLAATLGWISLRGVSGYLLGWPVVALECIGIALSLFRGAWIGAAIVVLGWFVLRAGRGRLMRLAALALAAAIFYVGFVQLENTSSVFRQRVSNTSNVNGRLAAYQQGFALFRSAPLFGVGVSQYEQARSNVAAVEVSGTNAATDPHSSYLGVLAEQGLFGFLPLVAATLAVPLLVRALRRRRRDPTASVLATTIALAGIGYLIMSLTLEMIRYGPSNAVMAILLGCGVGWLDWRAADPDARTTAQAV